MAAPLLLYLDSSLNPQRTAIGPTLASAAERAGWGFECYYDGHGRGRHFGGGDTQAARPGWPSGGLVAGGRHLDQLLWLATAWDIRAVGDPASPLWQAVDAAGCAAIARSTNPATIYEAAFAALAQKLPNRGIVVDAQPQGKAGVVTAPYLAPELLRGEPQLALEVSADQSLWTWLDDSGVRDVRGLYVDESRGAGFPGGLSPAGQAAPESYADFTAQLADRFAGWGEGVFLGDPDLVAAQLPRIRRLRLIPLHGRPQTAVIARAAETIRSAREPVYGRQYDDRDFIELAKLGRGLQVVDPGPPFDAASISESRSLAPGGPAPDEPGDDQLQAWADEGRLLTTLLFWCGMVRELDCLPRILDLAAETGLAAGLLLTTESFELADGSALRLLVTPPERGGVGGLLEPLLASTGRGVAAEALLPEPALASSLTAARAETVDRLPERLAPAGWWPLLDADFVAVRKPRLRVKAGRPAILFESRGEGAGAAPGGETSARPDLRSLAGHAVRRAGLDRLFEARRPYDDVRPGTLDRRVADAVQAAGFRYMWSKSGFGRPRILRRDGEFVALSLTAGKWEGWSPFYTVSRSHDLTSAERRLRRARRPGWLVGTVDSPLWLLSGEVLEHGSRVYGLARVAADGGRSGELINVTPNVIARYARLLDERGLLDDQ